MPLSINIGLSRKASKDYQSSGVSINVTAELDATLLTKPDELQQQIAGLYSEAEAALERQAEKLTPVQQPNRTNGIGNGHRYNGRTNGNNGGYVNGRNTNGNGNGARRGGNAPATTSQRRAIDAIAARVNADPQVEAREIIGTELDDLSLRQASDLIDHLKGLETTGNGNGHR
jgi:hypothetical protein